MDGMDIDLLARQTLRALRGSRSQVAFSRRLGYRSNVSHTWETGKRGPTAATVFYAARRVGVDIPARMARFYKIDASFLEFVDLEKGAGVAALLRDLRRDMPIQAVADRTGCSRFQVSRWLRGQSEPRWHELLGLVQAMTARLLDFVAIFVDPQTLPVAREAWQRLEAARSLFWRTPRAQLVLLSLDLADYHALPSHDDRFLARRLGLELYEVVSDLERLHSTGQIAWDGTHYQLAQVQMVDTRRYPEAGAALKRWWAGLATQRVDDPSASTSYNVFTVSESDLARIVDLYRSTYRQMRAIVAASAPSERLVLVQQHILPLDAPDPSDATDSHQRGRSGPTISADPH